MSLLAGQRGVSYQVAGKLPHGGLTQWFTRNAAVDYFIVSGVVSSASPEAARLNLGQLLVVGKGPTSYHRNGQQWLDRPEGMETHRELCGHLTG
jgi:hypothetical protein